MKKSSVIAFTVGLCILSIQAEEPEKAKSGVASAVSPVAKKVRPPFTNYWDSNSWESISGPRFWNAEAPKKGEASRLAKRTAVRPSRSTRRGTVGSFETPSR